MKNKRREPRARNVRMQRRRRLTSHWRTLFVRSRLTRWDEAFTAWLDCIACDRPTAALAGWEAKSDNDVTFFICDACLPADLRVWIALRGA